MTNTPPYSYPKYEVWSKVNFLAEDPFNPYFCIQEFSFVKPQDGQRLTWDCCCRYIFPPESRPSCPGTCRYIDDRAEEELQQDYNNDDLSEGDVGTAPACETSHRYIYIYVDDGAKELTRRLHLLVKPPAVSPSVEPPRNGENALLSKVLLLISF